MSLRFRLLERKEVRLADVTGVREEGQSVVRQRCGFAADEIPDVGRGRVDVLLVAAEALQARAVNHRWTHCRDLHFWVLFAEIPGGLLR